VFRVRYQQKDCVCGHPNHSHVGGFHSCVDCTCIKFRVKNKYSATRAEHNGNFFHSKKERDYAAELDLRLRAGDISTVERQVRIPLYLVDAKGNRRHFRDYYMDFVVTHVDGTKEYVEVKGFATEVWKMKWDVLEAQIAGDPLVRLTLVR
jgi:hypothetical protein